MLYIDPFTYQLCYQLHFTIGIYYSACSEAGGKTQMTFTSCSSADCSRGCTTYPMTSDGMKVSCSKKADSYTEFSEFTYHYEWLFLITGLSA